jgi:EAL domain-containing protein (putative c-di-GMP-specific phosphodiesterase class I)
VHVAIDDFGTGYSGLDSFRSSPADIVKVDMAFVSDMLRTQEDREIVRSILDLIHRFGKTSVAEGVETSAQLQALREMGCSYAQGYLVGRPMPNQAFPAGQLLFPPADGEVSPDPRPAS